MSQLRASQMPIETYDKILFLIRRGKEQFAASNYEVVVRNERYNYVGLVRLTSPCKTCRPPWDSRQGIVPTLLDFSPGSERDMASCSTTVQLTTRAHFGMLHMHDAPASKRDEHTPLALATSCRLSSAGSHYIHIKSTGSR
jgi:hypothetical protein